MFTEGISETRSAQLLKIQLLGHEKSASQAEQELSVQLLITILINSINYFRLFFLFDTHTKSAVSV